jgi:hypothetical protein
MGVLDRAIRFDQKLQLHPDLDFALQHLQKHRIIWRDNRFAFSHDRWKQQGGNSSLRSDAAHQREFAHIQQKWGAHFTVEWAKGTFISRLHVTRRDSGAA